MCFSYQLCWYSCAARDVWDLCSHTISLAALFSRQVVPLAPSAGGMRDCAQVLGREISCMGRLSFLGARARQVLDGL